MLKAPAPKSKKTSMLEVFADGNFLPSNESQSMLLLFQQVSTGVLSEDHAPVESTEENLSLVKTASTPTLTKKKI